MRRDGTATAVLALGLTLGGGWAAHAQGPGLSTGSGVGTGAGAGAMSSADTGAGGAMTGAPRSGSGIMSGRGPGSPLDYGLSPLPPGRRETAFPFGPGVDVSFPTDPVLMPLLMSEGATMPGSAKTTSRITKDILDAARQISDPAERSLALRQLANGAIGNNQMVLAHHVLEESITASSQVTVPLVRDQRLIGLVVSLTTLSDALLRVAGESRNVTAPPEEAQAAGLEPLPNLPEPTVLIRMARLEWRRAVYLASIISNPTYRNEMLYRVAEDEALGSSRVANDLPRVGEISSLGNRPDLDRNGLPPRAPQVPNPPAAVPPPDANPPIPPGADRAAAFPRPDTAPPPPPPPPPARSTAVKPEDENAEFTRLADGILVDSWEVARKIDRLIWKNRAMVRISLSASDSRQYTRGVELARTIDNAESRSEALLILAEAQCRHRLDDEATPTYQAAAEAVASIPQEGLRGVMTGFLIDSLISSGRFDDARACTVIYPEESERFVALGAVAEAQGRRGLADSARRWIATEPEAYRSTLLRRVVTGVLWAIENERSKESPMGDAAPSTTSPVR